MLPKELVPIYQKLINDNLINLDLIAFMDGKAVNEIEDIFSDCIKRYKNNFKIEQHRDRNYLYYFQCLLCPNKVHARAVLPTVS